MNNKARFSRIYDLALMYIIAWLVSPPLQYGNLYRIIFIAALGIIGLKVLGCGDSRMTNSLFVILLIIALFLLIDLMNGTKITYHFGTYIFMLCAALVVPFICINPRAADYKYLIYFTFIICTVFNITTLRVLMTYSNVMRDLAKNTDYSELFAKRGVGGYGYCYSVLLLIPIALQHLFSFKDGLIKKTITVAFLITSYYMIIKSEYFLAILMAFFCLFLHFALRIHDRGIRLVVIVGIIILGLIFYFNIGSIASFLTKGMAESSIKRKLLELAEMSQSGYDIEGGEFGERYERYMKDLKYIFTSPLWGTLNRDNGNHSFILGTFASYGLIVGFILFSRLHKIVNLYGYKYNGTSKTTMIMGIILLFLNSMAPGIAVSLFILQPIYNVSMLQEETPEEKSEQEPERELHA